MLMRDRSIRLASVISYVIGVLYIAIYRHTPTKIPNLSEGCMLTWCHIEIALYTELTFLSKHL